MRAVNLIPADQRAGAGGMSGRSDGAAYIVLGVLAGVVIMALLYGSARHQITSKRNEVASVTTQAQSVEAQANRLASYTSFIALHDERVQDISNLVGTRFDWPHVFHELGRVLPTDVSLSSVQGSIGAAASTTGTDAPTGAVASSSVSSSTPPGSIPTLSLSGCTITQSDVAVTLARLRLIDGVSEVHLSSSSKSGASAGGSCGENTPTFSIQVTFEALPTPASSGTAAASPSTAAASPSASTPTSTTTPGAGS
jgi:hypothetical protein